MRRRIPKWRFYMPAALIALAGLAYLSSRMWLPALAWSAIAGLWAFAGWLLWRAYEKPRP